MRRPRSFVTTNETAAFAKPTNKKAECVNSFDELAILQFSEVLPERDMYFCITNTEKNKKEDTKEDDFIKIFEQERGDWKV